MFVRLNIETHEEARIRPSKTYQLFVIAAGSHRELSFIEKNVRNYITREVRNIFEEDDAKEFGKSMATFDYFGDVVSFDTTYNTNRYNLVLGSFVGVNHHSQSTLLGCALMKNDDIQSFKWLFKCWLRYMGGKAPKELYEDRHIWIPIYLDHHFWAGMRSTQRSESMHLFFNKFITRNRSLRQFVKQYDNCLASRERIRCCRFSHYDTVRNKISNRGTILTCLYP
ncbi:hypothetical protein Ahy_B09g098353 [Arachis hypogaea]|uniref:MULE transposase domain-containing protein n=1 Tax=Arachis hypogaea TaxID=3818 RepID=A0A444XR53_ARAHY|nr:hypothetical protein Ahy_B09g098353 [Arachis hypogaea]